MNGRDIREAVRKKYGEIAAAVNSGGGVACCAPRQARGAPSSSRGGPSCCTTYTKEETAGLPTHAVDASLGCGNPTALVDLAEGQTVLDLGSGGGIDVLLSARRVGPSGKVYGLDMTDEMLALARSNQRQAGVSNVEFLKGDIQHIPLPDSAVDVVISNCVINLAPDKASVLKEAFRVLRPGGRLAVSDIILRGDAPPPLRQDMALWVGCMAGALGEQEYDTLLRAAGFREIGIETWQGDDHSGSPDADGVVASAFIRARKP